MKKAMEKVKTFILIFVVLLITTVIYGLADGKPVSEFPIGIIVISPFALLSALICTIIIHKNSER